MSRALIRLARPSEANLLPAIERSAGQLFRTLPDLAWIADDRVAEPEDYAELIALGLVWVAVDDDDRPVGMVAAETEEASLHIHELDVGAPDQGRGLGRALLTVALEAARQRGLADLTLTTFRDVAWNAPFYERFGFRILEPHDTPPRLTGKLEAEIARGLPADRRCAMRLSL